MHYIIDGHNLIGQCRTISLHDPDDEAKLIDTLHRWVLRHSRHTITVMFDHGVYGHPQTLGRAGVQAVFAHSPQDADTRLIHLLKRISEPKRYCLVSSDRALVAVAEELGIEVVRSDQFAAQLEQPAQTRPSRPRRTRAEPKLSKTEVDQWLREFGADESVDE